ncbi:MAG: hypothetical protein ABI574_09650 [Burkholderiales bacterium]
MTALNRFLPRWAGAGAAVVLMGCATAGLDAQWRDPQFTGSFTGSKLLVACGSNDETARRTCEDQMLAQLRSAGANAVLARDLPGTAVASSAEVEAYVPLARSSGAAGLVFTKVGGGLNPSANHGSSVGFGLGGFGGGSVGFGLGVSLPIGGSRPQVAWVGNTSVVDAATGRTVWSATATGGTGDPLTSQLDSVTKRLVEGARKAGVL